MKEIHDGDRVRVALARNGMSHKEFAEAIGVSTSTLSRMLNESSWRTENLAKAGSSLEDNFFRAYLPHEDGMHPLIGIILRPESLCDPNMLEKIVGQLSKFTPKRSTRSDKT